MRYGIAAILAASLTTPAFAEDLVFTLINESSHTIVELYVSPVDEEQWGENILTVAEVAPGVSGDMTIADGLDVCDYDIRLVSAEGGDTNVTQNLCEMETLTVSGD